MEKVQRLVAESIDIIIILFVMLLIAFVIMDSLVSNTVMMIYIVFIGCLLVLMRDFYYQNQSIGKKILHLSIYNQEGNIIYDWKILIKRNLIDLILFPFSFVSLLFHNKSIGDIVFGSIVSYDENVERVIEHDKNYKFIRLLKIMSFIFPCLVLLFLYFFIQKVNYHSLRVMFSFVIFGIFYFVNKRFLYNRKWLKRCWTFLCFTYILFILVGGNIFSQNLIHYHNLSDCFYYTNPNAKILGQYEFDDYAYILYEYFGEKNVVHYLKKGDYWLITNRYDLTNMTYQTVYKNLIYDSYNNTTRIDKKYILLTNYIYQVDKTMVLVLTNEVQDNSIRDYLGREFNLIYEGDLYGYGLFVNGRVPDNYSIKIGSNFYQLSKTSTLIN